MPQTDPFDPFRYDDHGVLRVPLSLTIMMFWSAHHILMLILAGLSNSGDVFGSVLSYGSAWPYFVSDVPGLLVLFARLNRTPHASATVRTIWKHGIALLVLGMSLATTITVTLYGNRLFSVDEIAFWATVVNCVATVYLLFSPEVRDVFSEFPSPSGS